MFQGNKLASNGMALNYISLSVKEGKFIVKVDDKEVEKMIKVWDISLAFYVVGQCHLLSLYLGLLLWVRILLVSLEFLCMKKATLLSNPS